MSLDFPGGSDGKASAYNTGDLGSILGLGRSPGERNGNPLQYYCLETITIFIERQSNREVNKKHFLHFEGIVALSSDLHYFW